MSVWRVKSTLVLVLVCILTSGLLVSGAEDPPVPPQISAFTNVDDNFYQLDAQDRFSLECSAKGTPEPDVTWFKDGAKVDGVDGLEVNGEELEFTDPGSEALQGWYHCEAENAVGKARSHMVRVAKEKKSLPEWAIRPSFSEKPKPQIVVVGSTAEFTCSALGSPDPAITWTKNGQILEEFNDKNKLTIDRVQPEDIGTYACNVSNLAGYEYEMDILNILTQEPFFTETPRDRTISINQEVILRCSVKGYPPASVHWEFNGSKLDTDSDENLEVAGQGHLTIHRVKEESAGLYECVAENEHGSVRFKGNLKVVDTTTIEEGPVDREAMVKDEVQIKCAVAWDPAFPLSIQWKKDNVDLDLEGSDERISMDEENTLIIKDLQFEDAGTYTCVASTSKGTTTESGTLTVTGIPPQLVFGPSEQIHLTEGSTLVILCTVSGFPEPTHTWYNDTERLDLTGPDANPRVSLNPTDSSLVITDVQLTDTSKYICRADNGYGSPVIASSFVDIRKPTKVITPPQDQEFVAGSNYTMDCLIEADPRLEESVNITWLKDGKGIMEDDEEDKYTVQENQSLLIRDVEEGDVGKYECIIETPVDRIVLAASVFKDAGIWWWWIVLLVLLCLLILLCLICLICCVRRKARQRGMYGVKDIEDGKSGGQGRHNRSDIQYSIDNDGDSVHNDLLGDDDLKKKTPIFAPQDGSGPLMMADDVTRGSENSLLNLTDEELWCRKGMDEDGSFREGRYAD